MKQRGQIFTQPTFLRHSTTPLMSKKSQIGFKSVHDAVPIHPPCTNRHQAASHIKLLHCFHGCANDAMMEKQKTHGLKQLQESSSFGIVKPLNKHQLIYTPFMQGRHLTETRVHCVQIIWIRSGLAVNGKCKELGKIFAVDLSCFFSLSLDTSILKCQYF